MQGLRKGVDRGRRGNCAIFSSWISLKFHGGQNLKEIGDFQNPGGGEQMFLCSLCFAGIVVGCFCYASKVTYMKNDLAITYAFAYRDGDLSIF